MALFFSQLRAAGGGRGRQAWCVMSVCDVNMCVSMWWEYVWSVYAVSVLVWNVSGWYECVFVFMSVFAWEYAFVEWGGMCMSGGYHSLYPIFSESHTFLSWGLTIGFQGTGAVLPSPVTACQAVSPKTSLELEGSLESSLSLIRDLELLLRAPQ